MKHLVPLSPPGREGEGEPQSSSPLLVFLGVVALKNTSSPTTAVAKNRSFCPTGIRRTAQGCRVRTATLGYDAHVDRRLKGDRTRSSKTTHGRYSLPVALQATTPSLIPNPG